jgi:superfamily II DNA or RNA helicase
MIVINSIDSYTAMIAGISSEYVLMLYEYLSVNVPGANWSKSYNEYTISGKRRWDGKKRYFSDKTQRFPLYFKDMVINYLASYGLEVKDNTKKIDLVDIRQLDKINLGDIELLDYQLECAKRCITNGYGIIESPTSSGKTVIMASIVQLFNKKTLILVDRKSLAEQIKNRFESYGLGKIDIIHSENKDYNNRQIAVCLVQSVGEIEDKLNNYELLIVDEVHKAKAKGFIEIVKKCKNAYNRFGFSATIQPPDTPDGLNLIAGYGKKIFKIPVVQLIERGDVMSDPMFIMVVNNKEPLYMVSKEELSNKNKYVETENKHYVYNLYRNALISYVAKKHVANDEKVLILVKRIEHGKILEKMLDHTYLCGKHKIKEREEMVRDFEEGKTKILLAQSEIMGVGMDLRGGCNVMIVGSGGKGEIGVIQKVGRGLRKNENMKVTIYDFYDEFDDDVLSHSKKRKKIYVNVYSKERVCVLDIDKEDKIYNKIKCFTEKNSV